MPDDENDAEVKLRQQQRWERAITVSILAVVASGILGFAAQDAFFGARPCGNPRISCVMNLKCIEGAKATWALENHKASPDVPADADLFGPTGYIREKPACPAGGAYRIRAVDKKPRCSIPGHTI